MMPINNKNYFLFFIVFFIALEGIFFNIENNKLDNEFKKNEERVIKIENALNNIQILAKAYSIYDITLGQKIYGKNDDVRMPLASLAKIMAMTVALDYFKQNEEIVISQKAFEQEGDFGIFVNEKWNVYDLVKLTLVCSANDGAYAILEKIPNYLEKMNIKAKKLGMANTIFLNSTGLDINEQKAGVLGTAEDVNIMTSFALKAYPEIFSTTILPEMILKSKSGFIHNIKNTDIVLNKIPNILFSKTGFTVLAGGNLSVVFKDKIGHDIAITVLGSTQNGRFSDMEKLVKIAYNLDYGSRK
ncbi:MAG: serine hydrolase [bacterium]